MDPDVLAILRWVGWASTYRRVMTAPADIARICIAAITAEVNGDGAEASRIRREITSEFEINDVVDTLVGLTSSLILMNGPAQVEGHPQVLAGWVAED